MKKIIANVLAFTMILAMVAVSVSAKTYYVSDWAEDVNDKLELTWSEDPKRNVEKGEFMFSFLRMIQASLARNGEDILESDTDLDFKDVDELDEDEQDEAQILVDLGVLNGYNGYMKMDGDVTRAEASKILYYFNDEFNLDTVRSSPNFEDICDHWAESYIKYAYRIEMVNGRSSKFFDPEGNLTIQEMMQIMYNISEAERDFSEEDIAYALISTFNVESDLDLEEYEDYQSDDDESSTLYLKVDETVTYISDSKSYWSSSKPSVASVSSAGKITARNEGTAIITNGNDMIIEVIVGDMEHYVTVGDEISVSTYTSSSWKSSNSRIATVDKYGTVTGIKEGTVTISRGSYESYTVKVVDASVIEMEVDESIKLSNTSSNWKSSNEKVAEVSSKGTVTAIGAGTATISSKYASYLVFVSPTSNINMAIGDTIKFDNGTGWTSSRPTVASVSSTGLIKALRNGSVVISNNKTNITINVGNYSNDYTRCYTLYVGDTKTLGNGKYDNSWESDNTKIATVTNYGKVTAKKVGETTVYNDDDEYLITVINDDNDNENNGNNSSGNDDDDYDYNRTIVYAEGFEPSTYYNAWVGDTIKIVVESKNGDLEDVTLSNSKCKLTKDIASLGSDKYTFTVNSISAGACILTLEFEDGETIEFTINSYKE